MEVARLAVLASWNTKEQPAYSLSPWYRLPPPPLLPERLMPPLHNKVTVIRPKQGAGGTTKHHTPDPQVVSGRS